MNEHAYLHGRPARWRKQQKRRFRLRHLVFPLLGLFVISYFGYHAIEGDRGVRSWNRLNQQIETARREKAAAQAKQQAWNRKVHMLRPGTLNEDMLDERARVMLNYARKDEIVILYRKSLTAK